jgi:hypothetical protein
MHRNDVSSFISGAQLPCRKTLSTTLLVKEYERCQQRLREHLLGTYVTISLDGWSTPTMVPVLGLAVSDHLIEVIDDEARHTSEHMATLVIERIPSIEAQLGCTVVALVSDGASNMEGCTLHPPPYTLCPSGMRTQIGGKFPLIATYRCQAHAFHLCVKDYMKHDGRAKTLASVVQVLKAFKAGVLASEIRKLKIRRPGSPLNF